MSPRLLRAFSTLGFALGLAVAVACGSKPPAAPPPAAPQSPPVAVAAAAPALDPPEPALRLPRNFLPTAYRARLAVDPARDTFAGAIEIDGQISERSKGLWLHGRGLKVSAAKATQGGRTLRIDVAPVGEELLSLHPAEPLDPGPVTLSLEYTGTFDTEGVGAYLRKADEVPYVETQFESTFARRVFPCFDEPDNKVSWQLTLDVPKDLVAVANTMAASETAVDATTKRVGFAPTKPLPSYLIAFGVGPYEIVDAGKTRAGTPIRIIALKGRAGEARWAAETSAHIVQLLEDYFGIPYPYDKLDQLSRPMLFGGAMENAGLITYGSRLILRDPAHATLAERFAWVSVAAHELAHQWFGDLVTTAWWDDIWLNEGFATWLSAKIVNEFDPSWHGDVLDTAERETALRADSAVTARRVRQPISNAGDIFQAFDSITYQKGAAVLSMFEHSIGPEKFRDGVRAYLAKHRFGNATSADFAAAISEVAGRDVGPAFRTLLDQAGAPVVHSELHCEGGQAKLTLSQHRYVRPGSPAAGKGTPWQLPVCVAYDRGGARGETCGELTEPTMELALDGKTCPAWTYANAGGRGYYRTSQSEAELVALRDRGWKQLTPAERMVVAGDVSAFAATGELEIGIELSFVPKLLAEHHRVAVGAAVDTVDRVRRLVPDGELARFDGWVRATFGPTAHALTWQPGAHDDLDAERSRVAVVPLVAWSGDPQLRAAAVALAKNWRTLPPATRGAILAVAADADAATFDRLLAAAPTESNPELRGELLRAVSQVTDEQRLRAALALALDPRIERFEANPLIFAGRGRPQFRIVDGYFREHFAELAARFPDNGTGRFVGFSGAFLRSCEADQRNDAEAFVREHFGKLTGAERTIARGLENLDQCIAARKLLGPKLTAWLARPSR